MAIWSCVLFALVTLLGLSQASTLSAVNDTTSLPPPTGNGNYLKAWQHCCVTMDLPISPLTPSARKQAGAEATKPIGGSVFFVTDESVGLVIHDDIAFMSCETASFSGFLSANDIVGRVQSRNPQAIILYSIYSSHCNYTGDSTADSTPIFTSTNKEASSTFERMLMINTGSKVNGYINGTAKSPQTTDTSNDGTTSVLGPTQTTAVAMIILYSITGVITALFLVIIFSGAIRAHRHPERYGPRATARQGRPAQSRARGVARAVLDSIPIVKFGDKAEEKPAVHDVELGDSAAADRNLPTSSAAEAAAASAGSRPNSQPSEVPPTATHTNTEPQPTIEVTPAANSTSSAQGPTTREIPSVESAAVAASPQDSTPAITPVPAVDSTGTLSCSICTEDFIKGENIRVLPCDHKYHPDCVDPWLLNVSGTCPLCRIDLRPPGSADAGEGNAPPAREDDPTRSASAERRQSGFLSPHRRQSDGPWRGRRISRYLEWHGLLNARPEERVAALRRMRDERRESGDEGQAAAAESGDTLPGGQRRSGRFSGMFRGLRVRNERAGEGPVGADGEVQPHASNAASAVGTNGSGPAAGAPGTS